MFRMPKLGYPVDSLRPFMSPFQLHIHYGTHHVKYVETLNNLLQQEAARGNSLYTDKNLFQVIILSARENNKKIFNNAAQHYNHTFFWESIKSLDPETEFRPPRLFSDVPALSEASRRRLADRFGATIDNFAAEMSKVGISLFGSGYLWLVENIKTGTMELITLKDADVPQLHGYFPILTLDLWEHAYYIDYLSQRPSYIQKFVPQINWDFVEKNMREYREKNKKIFFPRQLF